MAVCSVSQLEQDACDSGFKCINEVEFRMILLQLLCNLSNGITPISQIQVLAGNYGGLQPAFTPSSSPAIAFDTTTGTQWNYYGGAWH